MDRRMQKLLLLFLTLALAIAPLRGASAIADIPVTMSESHCAQSDIQHQDTGASSAHNSKQGCDGGCCDDSCNNCVHVTSGISKTLTLTPAVTGPPHAITIPVSFSVRTVIPLLRPPASL
jgi:hypothetical protein